MRLAPSFGSISNFTVDRSQGVQSVTNGGFNFVGGSMNNSQGSNIGGNPSTQKNAEGEATTYTKKISIPTGGIKLRLSTEAPQGDIETNVSSNANTAKPNQITNNSSFGVQQNYGVTNTQADRLKNPTEFDSNFQTYTFGGVVFDSSVKK